MREDDARGAPQCRQTARFRASRGRLAGSIACDLHEVRFVVVEDAQRRDPASESLGIGGMSAYDPLFVSTGDRGFGSWTLGEIFGTCIGPNSNLNVKMANLKISP